MCAEEKEARKDLYIKAMSYSGQLKIRKSSMTPENEFHKTKDSPKENGTSTSSSSAAATPVKKIKSSDATTVSKARRSGSPRDRESKSRERSERSLSKTTDGRRSRDRDLRGSRERSEDPKVSINCLDVQSFTHGAKVIPVVECVTESIVGYFSLDRNAKRAAYFILKKTRCLLFLETVHSIIHIIYGYP